MKSFLARQLEAIRGLAPRLEPDADMQAAFDRMSDQELGLYLSLHRQPPRGVHISALRIRRMKRELQSAVTRELVPPGGSKLLK